MIEQLQPEEQRAMLELLLYMAKTDGKITDVEDQILHNYATLTHINFDSLDGNYAPEELMLRLHSPRARFIVLQEVLRLAHIDGYFADDEQSAILDLAAMMGISLEFLKEVETWVLDGLRWVWHGEELLDRAEAELQPLANDEDE